MSAVSMDTLLATPNQIGVAIVTLDGSIVSAAGDLAGDEGVDACNAVRHMLLDVGNLSILKATDPQRELLESITIAFPSYEYSVSLDESHLYIVKSTPDGMN
ncbi:hypothetical protein SDRG_15532 [Saprolegnia diclina VS20]|uniref:Late endosomal/lysosomal adaptor and MAPK and MTOR activator 5 n=1 Tax=Saprolegnia diclina (strain VS20) TaxID=1156394 RepID=T0RAM0_SAPDV|nr:hypothetical protein SDRG_15532 [Saprolegnia diclina VS20]EQC26592.1 hypothetical protein SDRG_15532 [Saprolegnia diclina VS20]|eukprot:XP_008619930.1 hypothetical protein SDRG_15532 [Saprolegnia diclina VS20]